MAAGRKPTATAIKDARGSYRKNPQRRNTREPAPKLATPKKPKSLIGDKVAGEFWKTTCGLLEELGVLAITDVHIVEAYCLNESQMVSAYKTIKKDGISTGGRSSAAVEVHGVAWPIAWCEVAIECRTEGRRGSILKLVSLVAANEKITYYRFGRRSYQPASKSMNPSTSSKFTTPSKLISTSA